MRTKLLGKEAVDRVTGIEGVITAVSEHLTGEEKVLIEPNFDRAGQFIEPRWVDIHRLGVLATEKFELSNVKNSNLKGD